MSENKNQTSRRPSRIALSIIATGLLLIVSATSVAAAGPNTSTTSHATPPAPSSDGATRINPDPSVRHLRAQPWDHISVSANGKRVVVYFWMGVQACNGLGRVDVTRQDGQLNIQLWTGTPKGSGHTVCPELAQLYKTVVHLKKPIITGGWL